MKFSDKEITMIKNDMKEITSWLKSNKKDIRNSIYFSAGGGAALTPTVTFYIDSESCYLKVRDEIIYLIARDKNNKTLISYSNEIHCNDAFSLILNWQCIKNTILRQIEIQKNNWRYCIPLKYKQVIIVNKK